MELTQRAMLAADATALASVALLLAFSLLGAYDTVHFHLGTFSLHKDVDTRREHALHTVGAFLFPCCVGLLYCARGAWSLVAGLALTLVTLGVELLDVHEEGRSRVHFGGLPSGEYAIHFVLSFLRGAFTIAITSHRLMIDEPHAITRWVGTTVAVIAVPVALWHIRYLSNGPVDFTSRPGV